MNEWTFGIYIELVIVFIIREEYLLFFFKRLSIRKRVVCFLEEDIVRMGYFW